MAPGIGLMKTGGTRLGRLLLVAVIVGAGLLLLNRSARRCDLELSLGESVNLSSAEAEIILLPEGTLVHRASFFFPGGEKGPWVRALHPHLQEGRRYRVEVRLIPQKSDGSDALSETPSPLSREFLFQGETGIRLNF